MHEEWVMLGVMGLTACLDNGICQHNGPFDTMVAFLAGYMAAGPTPWASIPALCLLML